MSSISDTYVRWLESRQREAKEQFKFYDNLRESANARRIEASDAVDEFRNKRDKAAMLSNRLGDLIRDVRKNDIDA